MRCISTCNIYNIMASNARVLLISNSNVYGRGYIDHVESEIRNLLGKTQRVLFVAFALYDRGAYAATTKMRFRAMGYSIESAHEAKSPHIPVEDAAASFVGGDHNFRLLKA